MASPDDQAPASATRVTRKPRSATGGYCTPVRVFLREDQLAWLDVEGQRRAPEEGPRRAGGGKRSQIIREALDARIALSARESLLQLPNPNPEAGAKSPEPGSPDQPSSGNAEPEE